MADYTRGIDLSHHREGVDLKVAKQQGIRFVISKCSEKEWLDPTYLGYKKFTKSIYLPFGGFCYWRADHDPIKQGAFFAHNYGETDLLPILDIEKAYNKGILSTSNASAHIQSTLRTINQLTGRPVMIYTNRDAWQVLTNNAPFIANHPLWVANWYAPAPWLPVGAKNWVFWQFATNYIVEGYPKGLDVNYFNGNEGEFATYINTVSPQPEPEPEPEPPPPPPPPPEPEPEPPPPEPEPEPPVDTEYFTKLVGVMAIREGDKIKLVIDLTK